MNLDDGAENDYDALDDGPGLDKGRIALDQVKVHRLRPTGHGLELAHDLDALIDGLEGHGEVVDRDVHVLQLLAKLLPLVIPEGGKVEVD